MMAVHTMEGNSDKLNCITSMYPWLRNTFVYKFVYATSSEPNKLANAILYSSPSSLFQKLLNCLHIAIHPSSFFFFFFLFFFFFFSSMATFCKYISY